MGIQPEIGSGEDITSTGLSEINLISDKKNLLKKGFTFTPTPSYSVFEWVKEVNLFTRRLALHKFHKIQNSDSRVLLRHDTKAISILKDLERENKIGV